jgi:hypothetical protein
MRSPRCCPIPTSSSYAYSRREAVLPSQIEGRRQRGQLLSGLPAHLYNLFPDRLVESELGEILEAWGAGDDRRSVQFNNKRWNTHERIPAIGMVGPFLASRLVNGTMVAYWIPRIQA